ASQVREITRWLQGNGHEVQADHWFLDKESGDSMNRPEFKRLQTAIFNGEIGTVVIWRLDRLSRTLRDGINTLADWLERGIRLVSTTQQLDFSGTVGQLVAGVLFAVAQMEQQTRRERQFAGIAAIKDKPELRKQKYRGRKPGSKKVNAAR